jgi:hypothetical protein
MSYLQLEDLNLFDIQILEGSFYCKNHDLIHKVCKHIKNVFCSIYFKTFSLDIKKTRDKLKIKIYALSITKDLVYFLHSLPNTTDILVIPELILNEIITNLPINLKKFVIISYYEQNMYLINNLLKYKIPYDTKIILKIKNTYEYIVKLSNGKLVLT